MDDSRSNGPGPNLDGPSRPARDRLKYFFPTLVNLQPQEPPGTATRPHVEDLPIINVQASRKLAFTFRADGSAVWNNKVFIMARHRLEEGRHLGDRVQAAMQKQKQSRKVQADFKGLIDQIVHEQQSLPGVGSKVVVRLKKPFLGHRAEGVVKFVGLVPEIGTGLFIGLELTEGIGVHDGLGYFTCRLGQPSLHYGVFVRGTQIEWSDNVNQAMRKEYGIGQLAIDNRAFSSPRWWQDSFTPHVASIRRFHNSGAETHR